VDSYFDLYRTSIRELAAHVNIANSKVVKYQMFRLLSGYILFKSYHDDTSVYQTYRDVRENILDINPEDHKLFKRYPTYKNLLKLTY
jgi:hypothetical protein